MSKNENIVSYEYLKEVKDSWMLNRDYYEDIVFFEATMGFSKLSKCCSKQVACVLVKNGSIISMGVNGTLKGKCNCNDIFYKNHSTGEYFYIDNDKKELKKIEDKETHHRWSLVNEIHAEMNAIHKAVTIGNYDLEGATAYISYSPCNNCLKTLALFGIKRIVYGKPYDDIKDAINFCKENDIELKCIDDMKGYK